MNKNNDIATTNSQELVLLQNEFAAAGNEGFEEADRDCYAVPFLKLLQSLSPECDRKSGSAIQGAEDGMFYNSATGELYPNPPGILVLPVHFSRRFAHWEPRTEGGGFLGNMTPAEAEAIGAVEDHTRKPLGALWLPDGTYLLDTREHYCLVAAATNVAVALAPEAFAPAAIAMAVTQIKVSRKWLSAMSARKMRHPQTGAIITPPMYSRFWFAGTKVQKNDQGSWYLWDFRPGPDVTQREIVDMARGFREAILSGVAKVQTPDRQEATGEGAEYPF